MRAAERDQVKTYLNWVAYANLQVSRLVDRQVKNTLHDYGDLFRPQGTGRSNSNPFVPIPRHKEDYAFQMQLVSGFVDAHPRPASCNAFETLYIAFLATVSGESAHLQNALDRAELNPKSVVKDVRDIQRADAKGVDAIATQADKALANLCKREGLPKTFSVARRKAALDRLPH